MTNKQPVLASGFRKNLNVHDQTFCLTLSLRAEYAQDMLRLRFDDKVIEEVLDLPSMKKFDTALHKADANKSLADVAYTIDIKPGNIYLLLSLLLIEHKSYQDKNTPLQIAQQVTAAYSIFDYVVPFLFAHTRGTWNVGSRIPDKARQLLGLEELSTPYFLIETHKIADDRLLRGDLTAAAVWGTMKYRWQLEEFDKNLQEGIKAVVFILKLLRQTQEKYRSELFGISGGYMQKLNSSLDLERVGQIEKDHLEPGEEPIVHELIEFDAKAAHKKGLQQGLNQGRQEGLEQGALENQRKMVADLLAVMAPEMISKHCKLPLDVVLDIQRRKNGT